LSPEGEYAFPASFAQRSLWSIEQTEATRGAYNVGFGLRFRGELDPGHLASAFEYLEGRHEILRTTLIMEDGELSQIIGPPTGALLRQENLEAETHLPARLESEQGSAFDLTTGPLIRAVLYRLGAQDHVLSITLHHSIVDAWSIDIILRELAAAYNAFRSGALPALDPLPIQYADYSVWQIDSQAKKENVGQLEYWRRELASPLPVLELPTDHPRGPGQIHGGAQIQVEIPADLVAPIRRLARENNATIFMALLATFQVLLHRLTGQTDLIVGTPITGRGLPETEGMIGFFLNMLAIRSNWSGAPGFQEILGQTRRKVLAAFGAQDIRFEHLVDALRVPRDRSRHPVFQTVFVYQREPEPLPTFSGCRVERLPSQPRGRSKFDLTLSIIDADERLTAVFEYDTSLFDPATAERIAEQYVEVLRGLDGGVEAGRSRGTDPDDPWNRTSTDYPRNTSVSALFEQQVDLAPDATAIVAPKGERADRMTYRELDLRANRLAHHLRGLGLTPGSTVAVALDRSPEFVIAILATLKTGAIYVPVDPALPAARLREMLEDAGAGFLVTSGRRASGLPDTGIPTVDLDRAASAIDRESGERLPSSGNGDSAAYIMFTSGSTGRPKGVIVPNRAIVRLVRNTNYVSLSADDVVLACAPVSFDASTFELWGSLLNGGILVLYPDEIPLPAEIGVLIERYGVTTLWLTSGLFHLMASIAPEGFSGLRQLLAGGDVLSPSLVRAALSHLAGGVLINGYGPTENTTFTCCHRMRDAAEVGEPVPIGRPISNTRVYVLDEQMRPVPIGVRGELWAGGDGVALGYRNDPDLTAARFRPDPFSAEPGARMYRTGDVVRRRADGVLEFFGRNDTQIKLRGFRVEAGEIERAICRYPGVSEALAVARDRGVADRQLVAYVVGGRGGAPIGHAALKAFLRERLPEYAVPSAIVTLPAFPLTPNGKIDQRALPEPVAERAADSDVADGLQTQLAVIWEQVLGVSGIGVDDNFFDLGGNSMRAIDMLARVGKALQRRVPVGMLYRGQTVATMARALREDTVDPSNRVIAIQPAGTRPKLFVVPGVDGNVVGYEALARALGPDQPLYGLRSAGLDGESDPLEEVEAIAASLLTELRRVQPRGPYRLTGFCMGGIIAFEMAQQLAAIGEKTVLLGLVDTSAPDVIPSKRRGSSFGAQLAFLARGVSRHVRTMREQPRGERMKYLLQHSRILADMLRKRDVYRGDSHLLHRDLVTRANQRAAARYRPTMYDGGVLLILSSRIPRSPVREPRLSWRSLVRGECTVIRVPGMDSGALLKAPYVEHLAVALGGELARAAAGERVQP